MVNGISGAAIPFFADPLLGRNRRDKFTEFGVVDVPTGANVADIALAQPEAGNPEAGGSDAAPLKLEKFLPYRLNVVASVVSQALSRIYADRYGIGVPEWRVLVTLGQYGMMTGKAIGAHSHMHKTKVSRAVAQLEKRKLVARRANRDDMREQPLALTPAGRAIYQDLVPVASAFARRLTEAVDPADRAAFDRALARLTERARKLTTPD